MNVPTHPVDPVIAVHETYSGAESAVRALGRSGFDLKKVSVLGKGNRADEAAHGFYSLGDRVRVWGSSGGFWGAAWGLLLGSAVFVMPPLGVVAAAGPIALALVSALEGAAVVGGVSAVCVALVSLGLPHKQAIEYEAHVAADRFLVIVHGSQDDVAKARDILASADAGHALPFHQAA